MNKKQEVYNRQYKGINGVIVEIVKTEEQNESLQNAQFITNVSIPIKNKKITLNELALMVENGFKKVNERLDKVESEINNIIRLNNLKC